MADSLLFFFLGFHWGRTASLGYPGLEKVNFTKKYMNFFLRFFYDGKIGFLRKGGRKRESRVRRRFRESRVRRRHVAQWISRATDFYEGPTLIWSSLILVRYPGSEARCDVPQLLEISKQRGNPGLTMKSKSVRKS